MNNLVKAYLEAALWSENDAFGHPLDRSYAIEDFDEEAKARAIADCQKFQEQAKALLTDLDEKQVGHDFWLTRNRHGAGFWDGDYPQALGEALTKISHDFGEISLMVGDNGQLFFC